MEGGGILRGVIWWGTPLLAIGFVGWWFFRVESFLKEDQQERALEEASEIVVKARPPSNLVDEKRLTDPDVLSGKVGRAKRGEEWDRRRTHDPVFANSLLEHTILELERIGKDKDLTAEESLRRVAEMVLPRGSRVAVTRSDSGLLRVRAAFRLYAVLPSDALGGTRHNSVAELRSDIEEATARVMKDLFDYCGARGIERVSVSCNTMVAAKTKDPLGKEEDDLRHRSVYRATLEAEMAATVANWREITLAKVKRLMKVDRDLTPTLTLTRNIEAPRLDPNEPLEF